MKNDEDIDKLAQEIFTKIKLEGLEWCSDYKKLDSKKVRIRCFVAEDINIKTDIIDKIKELALNVESVDLLDKYYY